MGRGAAALLDGLIRTTLPRRLREGELRIRERSRAERRYGPPGSDLSATVEIEDSRAWSLLTRGSVGLGEGYIDELWRSDDLLSLLRIGARELNRRAGLRATLYRPRSLVHRLRRLVPRNTRSGAKENISAHYDLGNDLFESFLDERMQYSCALFRDEGDPDQVLEAAQLAKLDRICEVLDLGPDDHLLEIGTGWGGLAIHAADRFGARVTTTTISRRQRELAADRIAEAGLAERIELLDRDYRDLDGHYDKLVSVEMIEAVGWQYFGLFFRRCAELLKPGGRMLLQAITVPDRLYASERATRTFANTHVFPGGCLPSEAVILGCAKRAGLRPLHLHRIGDSYGPTLAAWRRRFLTAWQAGRLPTYDARFRRLWEFYLTYCEAGFREATIGDVQVLFEV